MAQVLLSCIQRWLSSDFVAWSDVGVLKNMVSLPPTSFGPFKATSWIVRGIVRSITFGKSKRSTQFYPNQVSIGLNRKLAGSDKKSLVIG